MTHSARLLFYWKKKKKNHSMCVAGYAPSWSENPLSLQVHKPASWSRKVYLRILTHTYCSEPEIFNMLSSFALYHKPYTEDTLFSPILHIRSRLRGAARMMLSTRRRSSAASDAEETTALFSL